MRAGAAVPSAMLRLLPLLRALSRGGTGSLAPGADLGGAGLLPACSYCLGRAKPPASSPEPPAAPGGSPSSPSPESLSRGTFLALKRLLERSRSVPELLRWLAQNPGKASAGHYALALRRLGCLLPPGKGGPRLEPLLGHPDFRLLSQAVARRCAHFDDASLIRCLHAAAALGLPADGRLVLALQDETRRRLERLSQRDASTLSSSALRLRLLGHAATTATPPPMEACLAHLEKERPPQTLSLLLSYYLLRAQQQQREEAPPVQRQVLRLVRLALRQMKVAQEHERVLLEEMLALCAREAPSGTLDAILGSRLFYQHRHEGFVRSMEDWFPGQAGGLTPATVALAAKYLARHRLREPRLLDSLAAFLLDRVQELDSKMLQRLVFPFSRLNFRPSNHAELFPHLEAALGRPGVSPLATLNVLMSLVQLQHFPPALLRQVFAPAFLANVTSSPCGWIVRRYLSLLDAAVTLEVPGYDGPRLPPQYRVRMFDGALTADEANQKYSYKGLVGEALGRLVGQGCFQQDKVVPPGYCVDFLLWVTPSGLVLPPGGTHSSPKGAAAPLCSGTQTPAPLGLEPTAGSLLPPDGFCGPSQEPSPETPSLSSPTRTDPSLAGTPCNTSNTHFYFPAQGPETGSQLLHLPLADEGGHPQGFSPQVPSSEGTARGGPQEEEGIHRVVLSVNDQWHYCHGSSVLVGSRAMRSRHLRLLGYRLVQLPYLELEKVRGIEDAQRYLSRKMKELQF